MKIEIKVQPFDTGRDTPTRYKVCVVIGGVYYVTEVHDRERAMQLAFNAARDLGLPVGSVIEC